MKVYIIIPAFNEEKVLKNVLNDLKIHFDNIIVVDDASDDTTAQIAEQEGCIVLHHLVNRGQGAALKTGIKFALMEKADIIVTFDADGQHRSEDIHNLVNPILNHKCDITLGSRFINPESTKKIPTFRKFLLKCAIVFTRVTANLPVTDTHNGMRAMTADAAKIISIQQDRMAHATEILEEISKHNLTFIEVPVLINYSDYSLDKGQHFGDFVKIIFKLFVHKLK